MLSHPVYDAGRVQMFDATQHLVEQVGHPLVVQLHLNHLAQVGVHQLHHKVPETGRNKKNICICKFPQTVPQLSH